MVRVAVMGSGSWGTTVAKVCADTEAVTAGASAARSGAAGGTAPACPSVTLWARRAEIADEINGEHRNSTYLPGAVLPDSVTATTDAAEALAGADVVFLGVPSQSLRSNLERWRDLIPSDATLVSLAKGIEHSTGLRMSEVIAEVAGVEPGRVAVLSGPNLAVEVAQQQPAASVVACTDDRRARMVQSALATAYFRPYTNDDVIGCEVGGTCKNVIALACGMAAGMGMGHNTIATVITRGLTEITRLTVALGGQERSMAGLAGMGDLVATCNSPLSRNRTFGERLGMGETLEQASTATKGQVAEGVISSMSVAELAEAHGVEMPITREVVRVCHHGGDVPTAIRDLMGRTKKAE
ncbi:NAD(P)H-dependent glycerol-3-phosphate dehydrogenase [Corynebacterium sp.]|uniref:NAD(P)H-dependent glycerol-3-phosphate dehydrogenase n=1 Tax=Corynebacterium sp. TaxID=1720 RepID=UPI0025C36AC6|nr:NAD(P)H-dependent glycerol-3-phosphate dehydrogenase [Corynebacterium sp.]